jgi:hypothetical protein
VSEEAVYREPRVGEGQIPDELDRLNVGAFLLAPFWSLGYRIWPWFLVLVVLFVVNTATGLTALAVFGRGNEIVLVRQALFSALTVILDAVFAFRANRLYWQRENHRIYSEPAPAAPALVSKYVSDQRIWLYVGLGLLAFVLVLTVTEHSGQSRLTYLVQESSYVAIQLVVLGGAYAWDRLRRGLAGQS